MTDTFISNSDLDTVKLGGKFARKLKSGDIVALTGELGAGKTEFIKGICEFFNVEELVTSPTFTIINQYQGHSKKKEIPIYHIDLYRIKKTDELVEIGFDECLADDNCIKLIEWSEKAGDRLTEPDYKVTFKTDEENENLREIFIQSSN
ncbi:MAG: tRNA (adenosine(37)-N6)-threonylcarbamoyltransferase complex ATPase subunit type 1 TsaE [Candidatus Kapabacteria bacterium]|nr:tRNA (adenosine(37)-N6)-threonylcarbamoyltransferase complex ATPase subunit type 1 TsaE [Candidatus Kapabacteria bacterium]